ncbi:Acyl-coenzyme A:6-aminopenicillanic-acid-acyltransferase 40 kDa form, putative [Talaromyces stipitatus ATCC 10500]|uniref:Acyl-coenzyme A:6-aminopenicillanic-acid-acyltransferase 40 kDa form, putative n=1 Tax=Talaromyces stipitatus (strain ATCC 10500 / CBS 375.48 / QM 6759 / NRRL 1006) TaxID=441959 RepID=B8MAJ4_TALSN|nr:Acyl-coenzyme A:6-aminopenicillanic-acid-acyltransferase 40 kDa form, putative [Talaromyces stipitatus ATCC 10500]EED17418.1 Acyl-coenzyme A:6-aminopenicillanic-acid-acyltransferase 40 kDa form, putative [Talaromyces stipitatus ATCC 10500]
MLEVHCSGTPYEIGHRHGSIAKEQVAGSLKFYQAYFLLKSQMDWATAKAHAAKFLPLLQKDWPHYEEEIRGIADGCGHTFEDILALNVRTEISMGLMADGCTAFYWHQGDVSIAAQNWDWEREQRENLITLYIQQNGRPNISQITEAGIIGKIGLNSTGVSVTLNAIRARGVDYNRLPTHMALRAVLDSSSREEAICILDKSGLAASCHILVSDQTGGTGLECSSVDVKHLELRECKVTHTNHFYVPHEKGVKEAVFLEDSLYRARRINELLESTTEEGKSLTVLAAEHILEDEGNFPGAINRASSDTSGAETLFSIVMDLESKTARVRWGRPTEAIEAFVLRP